MQTGIYRGFNHLINDKKREIPQVLRINLTIAFIYAYFNYREKFNSLPTSLIDAFNKLKPSTLWV
jgi:hypothetical protein